MDYSANAEPIAGDFPADDADEQAASDGEIAAVPASVRDEDASVLDAVMPVVEELIDAAGPTDRMQAAQYRWALAPMAVWLHHRSGSFHQRLLDERNVDVWVNVENAEQAAGWRHLARGLLRRIGRRVNPSGGWPRSSKVIGRIPVARPYGPQDEALFRQAAALSGYKDMAGRLFVVGAGLGAGLNGLELRTAETGDLLDISDGRLAICVRGTSERLVPVRTDYTALVEQAARLADDRDSKSASNRFLGTSHKHATQNIAISLDCGKGSLSLRRARSTWVTSHLRAGTPDPALRLIAGRLSSYTIDQLSALAADELDPMEAVMQGLKA